MGLVKTINGLARANVKSFNGLASASIKTINGLDGTDSITPDSFSGLIRWWEATTLTPQGDNTNIVNGTAWIDAKNGIAATATANTPKYRTNVFGSNPAVEFGVGGTSGASEMTFPATLTLGDFTVVMVGFLTGDCIIPYHQGVNMQMRFNRSGQNKNSFFPNSGSELISAVFGTAIASNRANFTTRTGSTINFYDNKTLITTGAQTTANHTSDRLGSSDTGPNNVKLGAMIIYNRELTALEITSLYDNYLKARYALP